MGRRRKKKHAEERADWLAIGSLATRWEVHLHDPLTWETQIASGSNYKAVVSSSFRSADSLENKDA